MRGADRPGPVSAAEAAALFADLKESPGLLLAVSGGPDSTALLFLAARWRARLKRGPKLTAVTVDHGLRPGSRREAAAVKRLAAQLGVPHRTVRWTGAKPRTGIQEAARAARYRLFAAEARKAGARHVLTAHTVDDQAETVLFRLARGSGLTGMGGMARVAPLPADREGDLPLLVRPLLGIRKVRLIATLQTAGIGYLEDASNRDPRFTRARLRQLMPALAGEGLDAEGFARFAARMRRADAAVAWVVEAIVGRMPAGSWPEGGPVVFARQEFHGWPAEVALRLLRRAIDAVGDEGPVELAKLEALLAALRKNEAAPLRRTLAGAVVTRHGAWVTIARAPQRRATSTAPTRPPANRR